MIQKLSYDLKTLSHLYGVKIVVSKYCRDNEIVVRGPDRPIRNGIARNLSIWNLETGEIHGNCKLEDAIELHMNAKRYDDLKRAIEKLDHETEVPKL